MPDYSWPPMDQAAGDGQAPQPPGWSRQSERRGQVQLRYQARRHAVRRAADFPARACQGHQHRYQRSQEPCRASPPSASSPSPARKSSGPEPEIAVVAAETEEIANDAVRKIKVEYEVLPHVVREEDLAKVGNRAKPAGEQVTGDPDAGLQGSRRRSSKASTASR